MTPCPDCTTVGCCISGDDSAVEEALCKLADDLVMSSGSSSGIGNEKGLPGGTGVLGGKLWRGGGDETLWKSGGIGACVVRSDAPTTIAVLSVKASKASKASGRLGSFAARSGNSARAGECGEGSGGGGEAYRFMTVGSSW